jgi:hypothetical protein
LRFGFDALTATPKPVGIVGNSKRLIQERGKSNRRCVMTYTIERVHSGVAEFGQAMYRLGYSSD